MAEKGLTTRKLAKLLGWSEPEVSRAKNGEKFAKRQEEAFKGILDYEKEL